MRRMLVGLMLIAVTVPGCALPDLTGGGVQELLQLFAGAGGCEVYDANADGIVSPDEVRDLWDQFGFGWFGEVIADEDLIEALQLLGCQTP